MPSPYVYVQLSNQTPYKLWVEVKASGDQPGELLVIVKEMSESP